jgi:predicted membrane channel-forming protein YqfA (hemolysin III family)
MAATNEIILMTHVFFGLVCILASVWVFAETLHASPSNAGRIRKASALAAVAMWVAFIIAGYWYVSFYKVDKAIILKGPWPFAHEFFMETKEHLVIILLLLATYLPIAASNALADNKDARRLVLWIAAAVALLGLAMDGDGAIIAMGAKMGLMAK